MIDITHEILNIIEVWLFFFYFIFSFILFFCFVFLIRMAANEPQPPKQRLIIASMFLPISNQLENSNTVLLSTGKSLNRRQSFISQVKIDSIFEKPDEPTLLHPMESSFLATNSGNPGLYNAISSAKEITNLHWIGTIGSSTDHMTPQDKEMLSDRLLLEHHCLPVFVNQTELDGHYHNFCKQVLIS
jgi:trehalose-6-phosphate synthase